MPAEKKEGKETPQKEPKEKTGSSVGTKPTLRQQYNDLAKFLSAQLTELNNSISQANELRSRDAAIVQELQQRIQKIEESAIMADSPSLELLIQTSNKLEGTIGRFDERTENLGKQIDRLEGVITGLESEMKGIRKDLSANQVSTLQEIHKINDKIPGKGILWSIVGVFAALFLTIFFGLGSLHLQLQSSITQQAPTQNTASSQ